jgi:putative two-component system response regulator
MSPFFVIVDDEQSIINVLTLLLKSEKIDCIGATGADEAIEAIKNNKYLDIIIVDYFLPGPEGDKVIEFARSIKPNTPIIAISAKPDEAAMSSLVAGANMIISKPFDNIQLLMIVRNLISLSDAYERLKDAESIMETLALALEARDSYTQGHGRRVADFSLDLYNSLGLNDKSQQESIYIGGILHDIGKIGISDAILKSTEKLAPEEFAEIKKHPKIGFDMCTNLTGQEEALDIVLYHHERLDGSGYPEGLSDGNIPVLAQIAAVADVYDALTSKRTYRGQMTKEEAFIELEKEALSGKLNKEFIETLKQSELEEK